MTSTRHILWDLMAGQRRRYVVACAVLALGTLCTYAAPLVVRAAIDGLLDASSTRPETLGSAASMFHMLSNRTGTSGALLVAGIVALLITAMGGVLVYLKGRLAARATENIIQTLRLRLFDHLQHVEMSWHDKAQTGDVVQRCTSDVDTVRNFYSSQVIEIVQNGSRILIVMPILVALDWRMAIAATCLMPVIVAFAFFFFRRVQGTFKKSDEAEGAMTAALQENLTGIRVVRAFARQDYETTRFRAKNDDNRVAAWRLMKLLSVYWASSDCLCFLQTGLLLLVGILRVLHGQMTVGTLVAFISYGQMFIWPLREVGRTLTELGKALVSIGRIQEVLAAPREPAPSNAPPVMPAQPSVSGEIRIRDLHFRYADQEILRGITLDIPAGTTLALLGPSGSGKTTLINLLLRMYDYTQGSITLDGTELTQLDRKFVREQYGVVLQEPFLFSRTLADNMRLGRHTAADEEMQAAAHVAAIHETIEGFEHGYATLIGERGVTLSGGQRQRTAIARALLREAPILILDDALSAVDTHTEAAILHALQKGGTSRRTTILIAHRLSTLMHADHIAVMEQGRIVQLGTHAQLAAQEGLYRKLWQIQSALEEDLRDEAATDSQGETMLVPAH